ncbi:uncharacterized protein A4U43_C04F3340 [Asparagus officinalis]|uniref:Uncharacterized protein n=1 Tax=Asparagus officinalis TaxID=4686 RepID=A0A5P1EY03_ASPOF|nr:uncharacterized protein A4U43_C04F3340 [Asparagus officinalis]
MIKLRISYQLSSFNSFSSIERRQLRKERRESKAGDRNWREEVEERLMVKPKKEYKSWTEKLNLDLLAKLGTQWRVIRVSRINGHETGEVIAKALVRNYPDFEFKVLFYAYLIGGNKVDSFLSEDYAR